ncbi:chaperone NapD [uncultured Pantoea sp.]|jgi:periplasmic nitrate reductase NapD|uniref:chaperone NapD n=1 Tax=Pantoea dispersa TaxID=59814 RepID=UPI00258B2FB8|nr:chaperone NapD [uncultured Pantoea sp.]
MKNNDSWHVCGLVIQVRPTAIAAVRQALLHFADSDIAAEDAARGTLALTLGAADSATLLSNIEATRNIPDVLAVSLVYHQQDEIEEPCKEAS